MRLRRPPGPANGLTGLRHARPLRNDFLSYVQGLRQEHGDIESLGFRFGNVAYSCDLKTLPPESAAALGGLDVWIVDALRRTPHPSHFSLTDALGWIEHLAPRRAILTNMHSDLDYETLRAELPSNVEPGYDGMSFTVA